MNGNIFFIQTVKSLVFLLFEVIIVLNLKLNQWWSYIRPFSKRQKKTIQKICIFSFTDRGDNGMVPGLGDCILRNPAAKMISKMYPEASITVVGGVKVIEKYQDFFLITLM